MLEALAHSLPKLGVDKKKCEAALAGGAMATDEVMRRVEAGRPFRRAYHEVAAAVGSGQSFEAPSAKEIIARRDSPGGLGNLGLPELKKRIRSAASWNVRERKRFVGALGKLLGKPLSLPRGPVARRHDR
jgi:argininosuccinate lyase